MWIMEWDVILEGWSMGHWRGSGYGKGLGWEDPPCCSLFCLPWVLLPWWQHLRMEETQGPWGGGDSSRLPYLWSGHQSQKSRDMPQEAEYAYSTKLTRKKKKKNHPINKSSHWQTLSGICANPQSPSYIFCYGPSSNAYQQIPKFINRRRTDGCGWKEEQGLECPWWPRD